MKATVMLPLSTRWEKEGKGLFKSKNVFGLRGTWQFGEKNLLDEFPRPQNTCWWWEIAPTFLFLFLIFWKRACSLDEIAKSRPAEAMRRMWRSHSKPWRHWLVDQSAFSQKTQPSLRFCCWVRIGKIFIYISFLCSVGVHDAACFRLSSTAVTLKEIFPLKSSKNIGLKQSVAWQKCDFSNLPYQVFLWSVSSLNKRLVWLFITAFDGWKSVFLLFFFFD